MTEFEKYLESFPLTMSRMSICLCMFVETKQNISVLHESLIRPDTQTHVKSVIQRNREF